MDVKPLHFPYPTVFILKTETGVEGEEGEEMGGGVGSTREGASSIF